MSCVHELIRARTKVVVAKSHWAGRLHSVRRGREGSVESFGWCRQPRHSVSGHCVRRKLQSEWNAESNELEPCKRTNRQRKLLRWFYCNVVTGATIYFVTGATIYFAEWMTCSDFVCVQRFLVSVLVTFYLLTDVCVSCNCIAVWQCFSLLTGCLHCICVFFSNELLFVVAARRRVQSTTMSW